MSARTAAQPPLVVFAGIFVLCLAHAARAQSFFGGGAVAFDPEISTAQSGALLDAQVVVSYDRKYVTIGAQFSESRLLALRDFPVVGPATQGFVGGVNPLGGTGGGATGGGGSGAGGATGGGGVGGGSSLPAGSASARGNPSAARAAGGNARARRNIPDQPLPMPSASPTEIDRRAVAARS